jgi:hypothetical protein
MLLASVPVSASLAWKHQSWVAVVFALICVVCLGILWRWGARRVVRIARDGTIRLRDHRGTRCEYPVDRIEEVEVSGDPEAHGGRDYQVILLVRHAGWVSLNAGATQPRTTAVTAANAIRLVLGWAPLKEGARAGEPGTGPQANRWGKDGGREVAEATSRPHVFTPSRPIATGSCFAQRELRTGAAAWQVVPSC